MVPRLSSKKDRANIWQESRYRFLSQSIGFTPKRSSNQEWYYSVHCPGLLENMESGPVASLDLKYSYISVSISVSKDSLIVRLRHPVCLLPSQWIRKSGDDCHWITIKSLYFIQYINIKTSEWIQSLFCGRMLISCTLNLTERVCHLRGSPT